MRQGENSTSFPLPSSLLLQRFLKEEDGEFRGNCLYCTPCFNGNSHYKECEPFYYSQLHSRNAIFIFLLRKRDKLRRENTEAFLRGTVFIWDIVWESSNDAIVVV